MINTRKIKGRMAEMGLSQRDVAEAIGVAQSTLNQKINKIRPMDLEEAEKICEKLKIPFSKFDEYFFYHGVA